MFNPVLSPQNVATLLQENQIQPSCSKIITFKKKLKLRKRADMWSVFWMGETNVNKKTHDDQYYEIIRGQI